MRENLRNHYWKEFIFWVYNHEYHKQINTMLSDSIMRNLTPISKPFFDMKGEQVYFSVVSNDKLFFVFKNNKKSCILLILLVSSYLDFF